MTSAITRGLLLAVLLVAPAAAQTTSAPASQRPPCEAAPDDEYGYTRERPIQVGGSPMYGAARQRRYLDSLRGPEGQPVTYRRMGQDRAPDGTILDAYQVNYEGLEKPITLFLDWYHYTAPRLPRGFSCAGLIALGLPPVDPFQESDQVRRISAAQAATANLSPIPAAIEGKPPVAEIYDYFRLLALAARAAAAEGKSINPTNGFPDLKGIGMIVVVHPYRCDERVFEPAGVGIHAQNGALVPRPQAPSLAADQVARVLPGVDLPAGAKAFAYQLPRPRPNDTIVASYREDGCDVTGNVLRLDLRATPLKPLETPAPARPDGFAGEAVVFLQAIADFEGRFQDPVYIGGPQELVAAAREAVGNWRAEPARINGAPIAVGALLQVRFRTPAARR